MSGGRTTLKVLSSRPYLTLPLTLWLLLSLTPPHILPCPTQQELELALNEITPGGAAAVAAAVAAKPALRRLNLRENELEDEGAVIVAKVRIRPAALSRAGGPPGWGPFTLCWVWGE